MRENIVKDKEFCILSRSIDNASKCSVCEINEDFFSVKLENKGKFEVDESVELFTMTDKGQLYFETIVKNVNDDIISMWYPISFKYLQRREYSRIKLNKEITLNNGSKEYKAKIIDLSAGGLKLQTDEQIELLKQYNLCIDIETKQLTCIFEPIRVELYGNKFISSGRFTNINNYDRISLVQYCFIKQIENRNK